jgi:ATP-dependent exoDNAse (exonuclease V) alpha subunit
MKIEETEVEKLDILECRDVQIEYTMDQLKALTMVRDFMESDDKYFLLSGYAGTGKTTIAENITKYTEGTLLAPTNAAVMRLLEKIPSIRNVSTIHKTIYGFPDPKTGKWNPKTMTSNVTYIIDECSMIDMDVLKDLMKLSVVFNNKIIFMGDGFQLPPVGQDPKLFSWEKNKLFKDVFFEHNKIELTEVKRQDGQILSVATHIREMREAVIYDYEKEFKLVSKFGLELMNDIVQENDFAVITYSNRDRMTYNKQVRFYKFRENNAFENVVNKGERVISVSNTEKNNGERYVIENPKIIDTFSKTINIGTIDLPIIKSYDFYFICDKDTGTNTLLVPELDIASLHGHQLMKYFMDYPNFIDEMFTGDRTKDGDKRTIDVWNKSVNIATYGYAMTAHKAQGNEYEHVYINADYLQEKADKSHARWIYTAITRGKKNVRLKYNKLIKIVDVPLLEVI